MGSRGGFFVLFVLQSCVFSTGGDDGVTLAPRQMAAWEKFKVISSRIPDSDTLNNRMTYETAPTMRDVIPLGQRSEILQNLAKDSGIDRFAAELQRAKDLDNQVALTHTFAAMPEVMRIPGSPNAVRPVAANQQLLTTGLKSASVFYENLLANTEDYIKRVHSEPNLLLNYMNKHRSRHEHRSSSSGPSLTTDSDTPSFLQLKEDPFDPTDPRPSSPDTSSTQDANGFFTPPSFQGSPTALTMAFHTVPFLSRVLYGFMHDMDEKNKRQLFGRDYTQPPTQDGPPRYSRDGILPKESIQGYKNGDDYTYYEKISDTKPLHTWWNYKGTSPPPWFTNNAPPNRPHFMRSPVPVPKPPFKSPFNKQMFAKGYFQQKPAPWPAVKHPMVPGQAPGEGSMKCPCPGNPMMMCDCLSTEYKQDSEAQNRQLQAKYRALGYEPAEETTWQKLEKEIQTSLMPQPNLEAMFALMFGP